MAKFDFDVLNIPDFGPYEERVENAMKKALDEIADDLLLTAQKRAPVDSTGLEKSGTRTAVNSNMEVEVSFSAKNRGFNYARQMDKSKYNLGKESQRKQGAGKIKSKFAKNSMPVGPGYLSNTAKRSKQGYIDHVKKNVYKQGKFFTWK